MDGWGYVLLAYGIVWTALVLYWLSLRGRLSRAETKLSNKAERKTGTHA